MSEPDNSARQPIPEHLILSRLEQSDQMREFFIQMWLQNPELARQGGGKVQNLLRPLTTESAPIACQPPSLAGTSKQRGISLIELIMFIVIVSIALAGIMLVMNQITGHSADTLSRKQAQVVADALLEEIEAHSFADIPTAVSSVTPASGIAGYTPVAALDRSIWKGIPAASEVRVTVTVTDPQGNKISATGYRTAY